MKPTQQLRLGWLDARTADIDSLRERIETALAAAPTEALTIGFINPHVYVTATSDGDVRRHLDACDLVCVDGIGIRLAQRLSGHGSPPRTVAEQLFRSFWEGSTQPVRAVLIGVEPRTVARAAEAMNRVSRGPRIVATLDGFADYVSVTAFLLSQSDVRLVLIGAGSPRSEAIALLARAAVPDAVVFHCGAGTIKTWAGMKRRAPAWMSRAGLEWFHRIVFEPHARTRYLVGGPRFLAALLRTRQRHTDSREALR